MFIVAFGSVHRGRPRRWQVVGAFVVALVLAGTVQSVRAQQTLSLDQALRLAQDRSRQLVGYDSAAAAARDMAVAVGTLPDPTLKAGINNLPVNGPDQFSVTSDSMTMRSIGVMQEFTREEKRRARASRLEREADAAVAGRTLTLANLQRDTAVAWLDRYYQERMRDVLVAQRDEAKLQIEAADALYRTGRGMQADVFAARSSVAQIEDRIAQSDRQIATATTQLSRWVGESAAQQALEAAPSTDSVRLDAAELQTQLEHHPQIAIMARQEDVARADADIARANKRADWTVELMYSQRGPSYSNMISLNVSIPLQWDQKNRQERELAAKLAMAEQMRAQREEASREHVAEARMMLQEWQSDRERITRYDSSLIPLAVERTRAALIAYRGGMGSLTSVLEARRNEIDVRMERLRLEMDIGRLWAQLNYLVPTSHNTAASRP
jgi:outer membrane protein TolC